MNGDLMLLKDLKSPWFSAFKNRYSDVWGEDIRRLKNKNHSISIDWRHLLVPSNHGRKGTCGLFLFSLTAHQFWKLPWGNFGELSGMVQCYGLNCVPLPQSWGFPGGASGKELACQCRRHKRCRFNPWVGKIPWRRAWQPTPVVFPGEAHGQRSLVGYTA